ncbi:hypothetical protein BE17_37745 [Sorangium cellulosum]|uniref:Uncharacterized protein n=1 Tax=Sorangium cellulosum TaxID=56 RepID=A0A150S9G7_SORCE|nr:hypothetical protein BE17_37745 [Sorangium cellulosum]
MARLPSREGGGTERCLGLVVLLDVVLDLEMPVPPEVTEHPPDGRAALVVRDAFAAHETASAAVRRNIATVERTRAAEVS